MSELKYESLIPQEYSKVKQEFDDQTVLFILNGTNMPIIGYSGEFLFKRTIQKTKLDYISTDKSEFTTQEWEEMTTNTHIFRYYERVKDMIFKYGLKRELYKNYHGAWVDMSAVRKNMALFLQMVPGIIDESLESGEFETSTYVKIGDYIFNHVEDNPVLKQYLVDPKDIPRATYIDSNGKYWSIGPGDGTITVKESSGYTFKHIKEDENIDNVHVKDDKYIVFSQVLGDYETGIEASKNYEDNDAHKFDDLKLTFTHSDKITPFTDLDNLIIMVNGLVVDYKRDSKYDNVIYLPNVVRLSTLQLVGLKRGYGPSSHLEYVDVGDKKCINYEFDNEKCKYSMKFDVKIRKWDNVKLSHFVSPINIKKILKTETYSMNTFWLPYKLLFSNKINRNKTLLICGGEIIPQSEWDIDPQNPNVIRLLYNDFEFEQLMNEMTAKMRIYLTQVIEHEIANEPKLGDYILDMSSEEKINEGFKNYVAAMNEFIANETGGLYDKHYALSAITSVAKQFSNKSYSIITISTIEDASYDVEFFENRDEIIVDKPRINELMNLNWSIDDILIINGISHDLVNVYDSNFKVPLTSWLPYQDKIFDHCDAYKLQVIKVTK